MFRPGVRDPLPPTANGGTLQEVLQHIWVPRRVHRGAIGAAVGG